VGKSTLASILRAKLGCVEEEFKVYDFGSEGGIDTVRGFKNSVGAYSLYGGKSRIYFCEEIHGASSEAQSALLLLLENLPSHVYFFLATNYPEKLKPALLNRCCRIHLKPLDDDAMNEVLSDIITKEKMTLSAAVRTKIVAESKGSARFAVQLLEKMAGLATDKERLAYIESTDTKNQAFEIVKALGNSRTKWPEMVKLLESIEEVEKDPERIRHLVLACAKNALKKNWNGNRAYLILLAFESNWYDSKSAGLWRACWEVVHAKD
jgi:DNA polymerase III gamma/tau subunit